jgi:hypothetical protein
VVFTLLAEGTLADLTMIFAPHLPSGGNNRGKLGIVVSQEGLTLARLVFTLLAKTLSQINFPHENFGYHCQIFLSIYLSRTKL